MQLHFPDVCSLYCILISIYICLNNQVRKKTTQINAIFVFLREMFDHTV